MIITTKNVVELPALPFASRRGGVCRRRAAFLTERPRARRMTVSPGQARILAARRALTYAVSTDELVQRYHDAHAIENPTPTPRAWPWSVATVALLVAIVAACAHFASFARL